MAGTSINTIDHLSSLASAGGATTYPQSAISSESDLPALARGVYNRTLLKRAQPF